MIVVIALAAPISAAFGEPKVHEMLVVMSAVPLLQNLGQVNEAFLRNSFAYRGLAVRNAWAALLSGAASAAAAAAGLGVYALVIQKLVYTASYTAAVWIVLPWMPRLRFARSDAANLVKVGFDVVVANLINVLNPRIVDFFVGYFLGVVILGYLRIAWRLFDFIIQLVIQPISNVAISSLTQFHHDRDKLKESFLGYLQFLALLTAPVFIGIGLLSKDVLYLVAGPQWSDSAIPLAILSTTGLVTAFTFLFPPAMIAIGRTDVVRWQAIAQTIVVAVVTLITAQTNIVLVLIGHVARVYLFAGINACSVRRLMPLSWRDLGYRLGPPTVSTLVMVASVWAIEHAIGPIDNHTERILILGGGGACAYFAALMLGDLFQLWPRYNSAIMVGAREALRRQPRIGTE
jgi:O-antigen/teichoic acid export membrane protein